MVVIDRFHCIAKPDGEVVVVEAKARATIVDASRRKQEGEDIYLANAEPLLVHVSCRINYPDSKVHGANMGPIWGRQDPGWPHVGSMNFAIWVY